MSRFNGCGKNSGRERGRRLSKRLVRSWRDRNHRGLSSRRPACPRPRNSQALWSRPRGQLSLPARERRFLSTASIFVVVAVGDPDTTLFHAIPQFTECRHRKEAQPALLVRSEGLIEWLPRSG